VVVFDTEEEAVALANDTEFGLVAYVYTGDLRRGLRFSERLESGMVGLNRALVSDPAAPFGGVKQSGLGREGGHDGLLEFMESKYIAVTGDVRDLPWSTAVTFDPSGVSSLTGMLVGSVSNKLIHVAKMPIKVAH
jgi:hypothetical protein